jgi:hypothetical protein|mmetsp:Transcript_17404/g.30148  ORF Transcript_17404/g.30148 Transcript_17404/m.30148 type:complete len:87 (+) Transcript_17404:177-437(+)
MRALLNLLDSDRALRIAAGSMSEESAFRFEVDLEQRSVCELQSARGGASDMHGLPSPVCLLQIADARGLRPSAGCLLEEVVAVLLL